MKKIYTATLLDSETFGNDISFDCLLKLPIDWQFYKFTNTEQTAERVSGKNIIVSNKVVLDRTLVKQLDATQLIVVSATGTNNVDLTATTEQNIPVCNVNNYCNQSVAQHVFSLIFALSNRLNEYQRLIRSDAWNKARQFCLLNHSITQLENRTIAIIGYGSLGKSIAQMAKALGLNVLISERKNTTNIRDGRVSFDQAIRTADIISLHCPLNSETENLIAYNEFQKMKADCILINVARGGIVNETDLIKALNNKNIAAAGFDVLSQEPPVNGNPLLDYQQDNLIITPHIAWASLQARQTLINKVAENIEAFIAGQPINLVSTNN